MILCGNSLVELRKLPKESIDICLTGPPFWRETWKTNPEIKWEDDGWVGHLGAEPTIDMYVQHMVSVFDEVKRVLKSWYGSCWVVLIDSYQKNHCLSMIPEKFVIEMINRDWIFRSRMLVKNRTPTYFDVLFFTKTVEYPYRIHYNDEPVIDDTHELHGFGVIRNHCSRDGIILDPFTGLGTTALAAIRTGHKFIGVELNPERRKVALSRMMKEVDGH